MRNTLSFLFAALMALFVVGAPIAYMRWNNNQLRNFRVVEAGVLYRSSQLALPRMQQVVIDHDIRTIVSLRDGNDPVDHLEESWARERGLNFVRIKPRSWQPDANGKIPAEACVDAFRSVMADRANDPVLVHCFAGIHRTGLMCATFRIDFQGWTTEEAEAEMRLMGYTMLDEHEDVLGFLSRYRPRHTSKALPITPVGRHKNAHP